MTFAEKLDRARSGSRAAYESLCLGTVDGLYTAALIALRNGRAAEEAVKSAISDGYAGIARIKDERHLRSWLVHELTKHIVDKLKEFRTAGTSFTASGKFAATDRLTDVERLVFAVAACFGYGNKELSVLTGMSDSAVAEKRNSAETRLGSDFEAIVSAARENSAPELLKDRYRVFDESSAWNENAPDQPSPQPAPPVQNVPPVQNITEAPREEVPEKKTEPKPEPEEAPFLREIEIEPYSPGYAPDEDSRDEGYSPDRAEPEAPAQREEEHIQPASDGNESVFAEESADLAAIPAGQSAAERFGESGGNGKTPVLNAEMFIAVVSAEQIKGSEFLRLIGNTRISNSVYREIEQNPRLTKKRLIELLEQSPLNETDYYKLLTAIKHRREVINAKEESRLKHERAGLFDGSQMTHSRRNHLREVPKTALQLAIEAETPKKGIPLTLDEKHILDDDNDYAIKTATSDRYPRSREDSFRDERIPIITSNQKSLGAVIGEVSRSRDNDSRPDAFHPSDMEGIFNNNRDIEAVDPIAAIYANEAGEQAKPKRIDELHNEWAADAKKQAEERAETVDNSSGTQEFDLKTPEPERTYDTREFDVGEEEIKEEPREEKSEKKTDGGLILEFPDEKTPKKTEQKLTLFMDSASEMLDNSEEPDDVFGTTGKVWDDSSYFEEKPEDPGIETIPVSPNDGMSVTQIITDYSGKGGEGASRASLPGASDVTMILDGIPKHPVHAIPAAEDVPPAEDADGGAYSPGIVPDIDDEPAPTPARPIPVPEEKPVPAAAPVRAQSVPDNDSGYSPTVPDEMFGTQEIDLEPGDSADTFTPPVPDAGDEDDEDDLASGKKTAAKKEKHRPEKEKDDDEYDISPDVTDADDNDDDSDDDGVPGRERYKGNEYFHDDDEYYEGVNRGKIIFCAICAVLLVAGAVSMKFVFGKDKPDVLPDNSGAGTSVSETAAPPVTEKTEEPETKPVDDSEIIEHITEPIDGETEISELTSQYMRASAEPYAPLLSKTVIRTDDTLYIYNDGKIKAVSLDPDEPKVIAETDVPGSETRQWEFAGFTVHGDKLYTAVQIKEAASEYVQFGIFEKDLTVKSKNNFMGGTLCSVGMTGGKLTAVTYLPGGSSFDTTGSGRNLMVDEDIYRENTPTDLIKLNGSETTGYAVVGEIGKNKLMKICGCMMCYPKFDGGNGFTLLCADKSQTFAVEINSSLEAVSAKRYAGRAFSEDCLNGDSFIGADFTGGSISGVAASVGKNALTTGVAGETPYAVAWTDDGKTACVLAKQESGGVMLYGFDMSGDTPASAAVTAESVYSERLIVIGDKLVGLKAEASADGERVGLRLSAYGYDGKLDESTHVVIVPDEDTPREDLKYMTSPAERDIAAIAVSGTSNYIAVPTVYFDGFSEVERVAVLDSTFAQVGGVMLYDEKSSVLCAAFSGDTLFVVTDRHIIVADASDLADQKTFILE